jgi:tryptophan synthase alpha chain
MANSGRIGAKFKELRARGEAALIPYVVAGDPDLETTSRLVIEFEQRGADLIELGVPFSDPMADGPANQRAAARGLSAGASLAAILAMVKELRARTEIPIVLFGYYNPIFHYGCDRLAADAARAGVDGLLVVDLPPEEAAELQKPARKNGLDFIYLLAPTTPLERAQKIVRVASGFLYYVSVTGVTGARAELAADLEEHVRRIKGVTGLPVGVGFGISNPEQAARVAAFADAVIVGSALSLRIEANVHSPELVRTLGETIGAMKGAIRTIRRGSESSAAR